MRMSFLTKVIQLITLLIFVLPVISSAQIIRPSGNSTEASSQLIYYYDNDDEETEIQVTNVNDTQGVWIHVQVFRNDDPDGTDGNGDEIICDERDFIDFLTPNDTHVYDISDSNFPKNTGETESDPGESTSIDITGTKGFIIITPVVSEPDLTAISFHYLIGNFRSDSLEYAENAMGREAVDFTTGERVAENTPLDGVTNGFVVLQPEELVYDFAGDNPVDVVGITFADSYGPEGLLGYQVLPGTSNWNSFIFDYKEDPTSCGPRDNACFTTLGINDPDLPQNNTEFLDGLLCDGTDLPSDTGSWDDLSGWVRMFVTGLDDFENHLGFIYESNFPGAKWMNTNKDDATIQAVKAPTGITSRASSQLVYYYDQSFEDNTGDTGSDGSVDGDSQIQITNTNDTQGVWVHVQIFRSFNPDNDLTTPDNVICDERNFIDFLTPNDTHVYFLAEPNFTKNIGETEVDPGEMTSIDVTDTKGFIVVTPVVSEADLTAISFQHLIGATKDLSGDLGFVVPAMGRDAIDLTTGELLADTTPLDGITGGFVLLQPDEFLFNFLADAEAEEIDIIGVSFIDQYGPEGLLGYQVLPGSTNWTTFIFDYKEDPTSCGTRPNNCFLTVGLNDSIQQSNEELTDEDFLCPGTITPQIPDPEEEEGDDRVGWTRIFVSGIDDFENNIGFVVFNVFEDSEDIVGATNMVTRGEREFAEIPDLPEDCAVEGDEDEDGFADCLDTDCATAENCETGEEECADTMDNDEDGDTDCEDLGCDGFAGCEFGEEVSCDDGIDNDADGDTDDADSDCMAADTGGDGGDGGGCAVAASTTSASAAANILVPMLSLFGIYGIRRRIRK